MKGLVKIMFFGAALLFSAALIASPVRYSGKITCEGRGVAGVSVTDGRHVVRSDAKGRYVLESDGTAEFVYISVPSGYEMPEKMNHTPYFWRNVSGMEGKSATVDFSLVRDPRPQNRHLFMYWADIQVYEPHETEYVKQAAADARKLVADNGDIPAFIVSGGDIIGDWTTKPSLFLPVADAVAESGLSFYNVLGNHDIETDARSNEGCRKTVNSLWGPTWYSFNKGKVHYVVLDNVFFLAYGYKTVGYIEEEQLAWLEEDLKSVPEGSTVMVSMHIPTYSKYAENRLWSKEELNKITCNRNALYDILKPYNAHICSAHEHYAENYVLGDRLFEHVNPPLSGLFWQSLYSCDGLPWGYMVYEADGDEVKWYYKAVGRSRDEQFTAYAPGEDPMRPDEVVVNVWNYDPAWKVEWWENGEYRGEMTRFSGWDRTICRDVEERREKEFKWKYIGAGETRHLFSARPLSAESVIEVIVTDRFGKEYKWSEEKRNEYDVVVVGGSASGTSAAIQAARSGAEVLLIEESDWLGGMLTSAGVSATDGCYNLRGGIWDEFRDSLELVYGGPEALKTGWVSNVLFEPSVGNRIFKNIASREERLTVAFGSSASGFGKTGDGWTLQVSCPESVCSRTVHAKVLVDATELGDVAAAIGVPYRLGMDSRHETGEECAPEAALNIIQDLTMVMTLKDYGHPVPIVEPDGYSREEFVCCCRNELCPDNPYDWSPAWMMRYGRLPGGKYMINWPLNGNDYYLNIVEMTPEERRVALETAKEKSLRFLYFLQNEFGYMNLGLADDEYGTADGFPYYPYHRESRRIVGKITFDINDLMDPYGQSDFLYRTTITVGDYPVDHHHGRYNDSPEAALTPLYEPDFPSVPSYGLPLGVMLPDGFDNLLVIEKSISVTNIVNGTTRLQPVVLQLGQAAGVVASMMSDGQENVSVRNVQDALLDAGAYILPLLDVPADHPAFCAYQRIAATGIIRYFGRHDGWANQSWLDAGLDASSGDIYKGLSDFYSAAGCRYVFETPTEDNVTLGYLCRLMSAAGAENTVHEASQTLHSCFGKNYSDISVLTRGECAVAIDAFLNPFHAFDVDINGYLIK